MTLSAVTPSISLDDPRLTQDISIIDEWCPVDSSGPVILIADRFSFLKDFQQQIVLALWEVDHVEAAKRVATCGLRGSEYKVCKKGKRSKAHRHTCHCWICEFCGQAKNLLRVWLRGRRYELRTDAQRGIEITGPIDDYRFNTQVSLLGRHLTRTMGIDAVLRLEVEAKPTYQRVRMVLRTDRVPYAELLDYLRKITHDLPGYSIRIHNESTPLELLKWMFESHAAVFSHCGTTRAQLFNYYYRRRLLKTYGEFYAPVQDARVLTVDDEYADDTASIESACNCGHCDGVMVSIPWNQRTVDSVESIQDRREHVDWSSSYDPFRIKRNQGVTVNSTVARTMPRSAATFPSPPPW